MVEKKLNILVIDDSSTVRDMLASELQALGYAVWAVATAEEAENILSKNNIGIIFLDLKLSGMGGWAFFEKIHQDKEDIIIIVMTAYESPKTAVESIEKGAYDYLIKPVEAGHLELIIKRAMKRYQLEQERKAAIDKRLRTLKDFIEDAKEIEQNKRELENEVNTLLAKLGRPPKYKV